MGALCGSLGAARICVGALCELCRGLDGRCGNLWELVGSCWAHLGASGKPLKAFGSYFD